MRKSKILTRLLILAMIVGLLIPTTSFVNALTGGGITVLPAQTSEYPARRSWFIYEAEPGTVVEDTAMVRNNTNKTMTIKVMALDGITTTTGGYTLVGRLEQNKDIGNWVTLEEDLVTLPPGASKNIDFTVEVPQEADVGSHPGGIVIWEDYTPESLPRGGGQIGVVTRVAARMYLTVPGDIIRSLEVEDIHHFFSGGLLYFGMTLHNKGNVQLTPEVDISLSSLFGHIGIQEKSQVGLVLRGGTIESKIPWQKKTLFFGRYVAKFRIHYGEKDFEGNYVVDEYIDAKYVFWVIPWLWILILLAILILLLFIRNLWKWLIIQKRLNEKTKKHKIKKGETLTIIADIYDIDPKKIAKFNLLKWPYDLTEGDILLIPQGRMTKAEKAASKQDIKDTKELEPVVIEKGDTIKDVASFAEVSVQEVIVINHLRWPYRLKENQELMIPVKKEIIIVDKKEYVKKTVKRKAKSTKKQVKSKKKKK